MRRLGLVRFLLPRRPEPSMPGCPAQVSTLMGMWKKALDLHIIGRRKNVEQAATRLQAAARGLIARRNVRIMRDKYQSAASRIQAAFRSYHERLEEERLLAESGAVLTAPAGVRHGGEMSLWNLDIVSSPTGTSLAFADPNAARVRRRNAALKSPRNWQDAQSSEVGTRRRKGKKAEGRGGGYEEKDRERGEGEGGWNRDTEDGKGGVARDQCACFASSSLIHAYPHPVSALQYGVTPARDFDLTIIGPNGQPAIVRVVRNIGRRLPRPLTRQASDAASHAVVAKPGEPPGRKPLKRTTSMFI